MEMSRLIIPYRHDNEIREEADEFRKLYWNNTVPVNVEVIAERAGIILTPIPSLRYLTNQEAAIASSKEEIFYDPDSIEVRFRFSIAHELGHYKLHASELDYMQPKSYDDWSRIIDEMPTHTLSRFEYQANEFAGRLLVPLDDLKASFRSIKPKLELMEKYVNGNFFATYEFIAGDLCGVFNVSAEVLVKRLRKEELNPFEYI